MTDLPALLGGVPVRPDGPPPWPPPDPDVRAALDAAIASGAWGQYHGPHVCALEAELASFHGVPHAITCASGTLAVEVALRALKVGPGDEVVLAAYDYESNFLTVHAIGARPVLIDVHPETWQLDPANLEAAITPQTKAIVCSHLHGGVVPMREVTEIASRHCIGVVEDAAQAPGGTVQGKPAGAWGDVGTLSFGGSKLLTAGRGGAVLFRNSQVFQRAKVWLHRGVQAWAPLSELQAAALRPQLAKLPAATARRLANVRRILALVSHLSPGSAGERSPRFAAGEGAALPASCALSPLTPALSPDQSIGGEGEKPAFYKLGLRYDPAAFGLPRDTFVKAVRAEGVALDAGFKALHVGRSPSRFRAVGDLSNALAAHERCVVLHHPVLSLGPANAEQVAVAVAKVYRGRGLF
jgi:dTDP-4-amino-4,6-dideoxygalactose transaminase